MDGFATQAGQIVAPAAGGGFLPTDVSGLSLWLDGSDSSTLYDATSGGSLVADGGDVARWEDKSGNGNHATQGTSGNCPHRRASQINSLDAIEFTASSLHHLDLTYSIKFSTASFFAVIQRGSGGNGTIVALGWSTQNQYMPSYLGSSSLLIFSQLGNFFTATGATSSSTQVLTGIANGASSEMFLDGSSLGTGNTGSSTRTDVVGMRNGTTHTEGFLCELLKYDSAISSSDREAVETYLGDKWGVTITH